MRDDGQDGVEHDSDADVSGRSIAEPLHASSFAHAADHARFPNMAARDMEGIFGAGAAQQGAQAKANGADKVRTIIRDRASRRKTGLVAPALTLCGLLLAGGMVWLATPAPQHVPAQSVAQTSTQESPQRVAVADRPQTPPQAMLAQTAAAAAAPEPAVERPTTEAAKRAAPADEARSARAEAAPVKSTPRMQAKRAASSEKVQRFSEMDPPCTRMGRQARARCMRPYVLRADRQMRSAYASATRAGVDRRTLKSYRNRWSRVLEESNADPAYVTASLEEMTRRLHTKRAEL